MASGNQNIESIIQELNIGEICKKAADNFSWTSKDMEYAKLWYARHWYLAQKFPKLHLAAISKMADDLWHQHIIDTPKYLADCERILGRFMNHQPIYGEPNEHQSRVYEASVKLYKDEFNATPKDLGDTSGDYSYSLPLEITRVQ